MAYRAAMEREDIGRRDTYESMTGQILQTLKSGDKLGIVNQTLRQDESISVQVGKEGFTVYRGQVNGLKRVVDEGQFLCGTRTAFEKIFTEGGFTEEECEAYLTALTKTSSAFSAKVPAGSEVRFHIDPETLLAFDMPPHETIHGIDVSEAMPIFAVGTFPLPEMTTHRQRVAAAKAVEETPSFEM